MNKKSFLTTLPDFLEIQKASFCWFLEKGLISELDKISLITDLNSRIQLNFFGQEYLIRKPRYNLLESKYRDITYSVRIYIPITIKLDKNLSLIYDEKLSSKIYAFIGELPLMTDRGTFIINGCERVIINQIIRSPGIYCKEEILKNGRRIHNATLIPNRGSWLKFEIDKKENFTVSLDKSEKIAIFEFFKILEFDINDVFKNLKYPEYLKKVQKAYIKEKKKKERKDKREKIQNKKTFSNDEILEFFNAKIFNAKYYDLGIIGRYKLNYRFNLNIPNKTNDLTFQDIISIINELINFKYGESNDDDIDHLKNRRVRSVGELLQTQFRLGLTRFERMLSERLAIYDPSRVNFKTLINPKSLISIMREFFGSSQLSQFLDQTNPLAELTHRRRISGLGPGGFSRDHVSFDVRDIHSSHYGRICPIETPEGQNAGLISSMAVYARINSFGFIETPFFKVKKGEILNTQKPIYLTAEEEDELKIAPADTIINSNGQILKTSITVRYKQEFINVLVDEVELIGVSTIQIISSAAALIPFLEHNDANRSLMGSNMQRQAVPLLYPNKAIIGTGLENQLATDAGIVVISYTSGYINWVSNNLITIKNKMGKEIKYNLQKYTRSNQDTCINQRPIVWNSEYIQSGQIIADGPSTEGGEMALGQNILIAYMPWEGYNFEDALLINEKLIYADLFTSIHIEKYDLEVNETKSGVEELTKDLPNINEKATKHLDNNGIVFKGKFVTAGDILVGKITPTLEIDEIPEARLLRAIFGEKAQAVADTSLRVANGSYGRVLDIRIFSRENGDDLPILTNSIIRIFLAQIRKIQVGDKMSGRHGNKGIISKILARQDMPYLPNGQVIDLILNPLGVPSRMNVGQLFEGLFGFAGDILEKRFKILPFDEIFGIDASRILINKYLIKAKKKNGNNWIYDRYSPGKIILRDGQTGEIFENAITVCKSYILKLIHLVDDKIHARSIGPYSLVTQQPLGGRSQKGGQRFGEMEVWALEAFGAAYTLQELLTIKSDDINGRNNTLSAIINGEFLPKANIPESFKVLLLELKSLSLDISTYTIGKTKDKELKELEINLMENIKTIKPNYQSVEII